MKVLIIPDKFKGTLRAEAAAEAIAAGWREVRPADSLELVPMSDGGDGFGEITGRLLGAEENRARVLNAAHESVSAPWWWSESSRTAIVESANVIGLAMLPPGRFHPFELDTLGLGQLLRQIGSQHEGCRVIMGIGGSATNDGGFGLARGLGFHFSDGTDNCIDRWPELDRLLHISPPADLAPFELLIASDVQNPLLGPSGATRIYGPQKGMRVEDFPIAERCLQRLTEVVRNDLGLDCATEPGTGAAGGLGYGLRVFLKGKFEAGFDLFARLAKLKERIDAADLVITGEGAIDVQTEMGKGTGAVANVARSLGKPCIGLAGSLKVQSSCFSMAHGIVPAFASLEEAKAQPARWLQRVSAEAARKWSAA